MKSLHILLVEDNEGDVLLTTEALEELNPCIKVTVATDGKKAIDFLSEKCTDRGADAVNLVLLDINLPKRNGHEVLKYIRSNKQCDHVPVLMLTTSSFNKDRDHAANNRADGYLIKPLDINALPSTIRSFLDRIPPMNK